MTDPQYRVLALDGGGMRGIFTAAVIAGLEKEFGGRLADHVDLIVGTSTGGIIALGLASGKSGEEMLDFYCSEGARIFGKPRRLRKWWRPKYDRGPLDEVLRREFGNLKMNDLDNHVCITAYELVAGTTRVWKDDHHAKLTGGGEQLVWKVAAATAAAPTFFAPVQLGAQDSHVDGGIWANNPAMVGITEAVRYGGRNLGDVRLLSVGTTTRIFGVESHAAASRMGVIQWIRKARDLLLGDSVSMAADQQARLILPDGSYHRVNTETANKFDLDDYKGCQSLRELGEQAVRSERETVRQLLDMS